jgi:TetR/AcrR family transcriptional repressor of nem operon
VHIFLENAMARRREFDDARAVQASVMVFWEHGYSSTSLAQLQTATGLSRSSLYAAYGSKRGLYERAARHYLRGIMDPLLEPMESEGAGSLEIAEYFLSVAQLVTPATTLAGGRGCLMLNTAMELEELGLTATTLVTDHRNRLKAAFLHALRTIDSVDDYEARAVTLTAGVFGLAATARFDRKAAAQTAETIAADVQRW